MNTPPDPQLDTLVVKRAMMDSRKFKALVLAVILLGLPVVCMGVALTMGKASYEQFTELTKWAFSSLAVVTGVFMAAVAHEDAAQKGNSPPITAGGNVTVTTTNPPLGAALRSIPAPPGVPTDMTAGGRTFAILCLVGATLFGTVEASCAAFTAQDAKTVLNVEQEACILANIAIDVPTLHTICHLTDVLDPELQKLLSASRKVAATKGAPMCRDAGAP